MKTCPTCGYPVEECPWSREQAKQRRQLLGYLFWLGVGALVLVGVLASALTCKGSAAPKYNIVANIIGDLSPLSKPIAHVSWYDRSGRKQHWDHAFDEDFKVLIGFGDQDLSPEQVVKIRATGTNGDTALGYFAPTQERVTLVWRRRPVLSPTPPPPDDEAVAPPPPPSAITVTATQPIPVVDLPSTPWPGSITLSPAPKGYHWALMPDVLHPTLPPPPPAGTRAFGDGGTTTVPVESLDISTILKERQAEEDEEKKVRQKRREAYEKLNVKPVPIPPVELLPMVAPERKNK